MQVMTTLDSSIRRSSYPKTRQSSAVLRQALARRNVSPDVDTSAVTVRARRFIEHGKGHLRPMQRIVSVLTRSCERAIGGPQPCPVLPVVSLSDAVKRGLCFIYCRLCFLDCFHLTHATSHTSPLARFMLVVMRHLPPGRSHREHCSSQCTEIDPLPRSVRSS